MDIKEKIKRLLNSKPLKIPEAQELILRYAPGKINLYRYHNLTVKGKRDKLRKELSALLKTELKELPVVQAAKEVLPDKLPIADLLSNEFQKLSFDELPDQLKLLVIRRYECKRLAVAEHEKMFTSENDEERFEAAKECVQLMMENWEIWAELDHFHRKNEVLGKHEAFQINEFEEKLRKIETEMPAMEAATALLGMRNTARGRIYKLRKIEGKEKLVHKWIVRYNTISVKLKQPKWEETSNRSTTKTNSEKNTENKKTQVKEAETAKES